MKMAEFAAAVPVANPAAISADIPTTVEVVAAGGGLFGRIITFILAPLRFLVTSPIAYFAERFWPDVLPYIKDRILSGENNTFGNYGAARKVGKARNVSSTTHFRSGAVLPTLPGARPNLLNVLPGTRFHNLGEAQIIDSCDDINTTTTFG